MNKVNYPVFDDQIDERVREINRVTNQIHNVEKQIRNNNLSIDDYNCCFGNVCETLLNWTGHTYVGRNKDKILEKAFQSFFENLYEFLVYCKGNDSIELLQEFAKKALYNGTLYRYLGYDYPVENKNEKVIPQYNNIYVSWSKNPDCSYLKTKLYGTRTELTCNVKEPFYGIDLEAFDVSQGDEAEVVFPTIEKAITDVKYVEEEQEEDVE